MSIVVAVTKGERTVVAADTLTCFGSERHASDNLRTTKVQRLGGALVATTGWGIYENILTDFATGKRAPDLGDERAIFAFFQKLWRALHERYPFVEDQSDDNDSPFGDLDASFLVVNAKGIYRVHSDTSVSRFLKYSAVGCAAPYALGAVRVLYDQEPDAERIAVQAVETAIHFDVHCGGDVEVFELGG